MVPSNNITSIFSNKIFRIPDYQRGFSWEKDNLEDFWQDITNLQSKHVHYIGMLSVEEIKEDSYKKWSRDKWLIDIRHENPYYIVDGQQRITTIIILLWCIIKTLEDGQVLLGKGKSELINQYIYRVNPENNHKSLVFDYDEQYSGNSFLRNIIFELDTESLDQKETVYTNNLSNCKKYFEDRIQNFTLDQKSSLFVKVTQFLYFDFKILEKDLDIFVVFETMNNRGKPLTNLEKLKNRLIYLSTILNVSDQEKNDLRNEINDSWKIVYKYLGLNKSNKLKDDAFLLNHWIMYRRYDRGESEFYVKDIFEKFFTSNRILNNNLADRLTFNEIKNYITSIQKSVELWFVMFNPYHKESRIIIDDLKLLGSLAKLELLGYRAFQPLVLATLLKYQAKSQEDDAIELIKYIEYYIFLLFHVSFRRSNTGSYHFSSKANQLYQNKTSINDLINDLKYWIYGDDTYNGYFDISGLTNFLKDSFLPFKEKREGFEDWKSLKFFLLENFLQDFPDSAKLSFYRCYNYITVEKITNFYDIDNKINRYDNEAISLGAFVLTINRKGFEKFQELLDSKYSKEILKKLENSDLSHIILNRGLNLLKYMEQNWEVSLLDTKNKRDILFLPEIPF
jgi:uncharacterized protein with ParB-like and HNH nuclease domain